MEEEKIIAPYRFYNDFQTESLPNPSPPFLYIFLSIFPRIKFVISISSTNKRFSIHLLPIKSTKLDDYNDLSETFLPAIPRNEILLLKKKKKKKERRGKIIVVSFKLHRITVVLPSVVAMKYWRRERGGEERGGDITSRVTRLSRQRRPCVPQSEEIKFPWRVRWPDRKRINYRQVKIKAYRVEQRGEGISFLIIIPFL